MTRIIRRLQNLKATEKLHLLTEAPSPVHMDPRAEVLRLRETMQDLKAIRVEEITIATLFRRVFKLHWVVEGKRISEVKALAHWRKPNQNAAFIKFWMSLQAK